MTSMAQTPQQHRVSQAVAKIHEALDEVSDVSLWSMGPDETADTLIALTKARARAAELELRIAAHAETVQVGQATGAVSTGAWWAHQTRQTPPAAARSMYLAAALAGPRSLVRAALAAGDLNLDQAEVIVRAVDALPADLVTDDLAAEVETHLLEHAAVHDAKALRILGKRALDVIAPEVGEAHENRLLQREEVAALAAARFTMSDDGHGKSYGRFTLPTAQAAMLKKALMAIAAPKHQAAVAGAGALRRPGPERMGRAFMDYIERYPVDELPKSGGLNAAAVILMDVETLLDGLKPAQLDTGERIWAGLARRLACEAGIIPVVLGGKSQVLDVARKSRLHNEVQRVAIGTRDKTCTAEGCDWPPGLCHVPQQTLAPGRRDLRHRRPTPLPPTPRQSPRPHLHHDPPPRRQGRLHQTDVGRPLTAMTGPRPD